MEQPALEKFILAKLRLPDDVKKGIKRYLPTIPTPTARLIKSLRFESCEWRPDQTIVYSRTRTYFRKRLINARWAPPPMRPRIIYKESFEGATSRGHTIFNKFTGEPAYISNPNVILTTTPCSLCTLREKMWLKEAQALERQVQASMPPVIEEGVASPPAVGAQGLQERRQEEAACQ